MNYTKIIEKLIQSYLLQIEHYTELKHLVQTTIGKIVLSRGDLSGVMSLFSEKQKLLDLITKERNNTKDQIMIWQDKKAVIPRSELTEKLNTILAEAEDVIKEFLEAESQLQKHLENIIKKGAVTTHDR